MQNAGIVLALIFLYILKKNPWKIYVMLCIIYAIVAYTVEYNLCNEFKTYTSVDPIFTFQKIKLKVVHYIQRPGLGKNQASMFKSIAINQLL